MPVKVTPRTRVSQASAPAKAAAKKTAPAKKTASKAPATKTTARATPSRARKTATPQVKDTPVPPAPKRRSVRTVSKEANAEFTPLQDRRASVNPRKKVGGLTYQELSELSGYGLGTEQFITAVEILTGGTTRQEVNHRVAALLPPTTRNGTPKAVSNLVSGVIRNLQTRGFTVNGSWKMDAPKA
jgi:hypothetical protein